MNVSQLLVKLRLDNAQFNAGMGQSQGALRELDTQAKGMAAAMQFAGIAGVLFMGKQAVSAVGDLALLGAQADRTETAFEELARQAGGSANDIMAAISRATDGTVSEMDAMAAANRGILLGLGANAEQWEKLTEVARFRARAMQITVTQALNDIATGIGRESRLILDNLGIILDLDRTLTDYGSTVNKTADELTVYERKQAIMTSVIREGQAQIQEAGGIVRDAVDDFEGLTAATEDLKASWGGLIAGPASQGAKSLTIFLEVIRGNTEAFREAQAKSDELIYKLDETGQAYIRTASGAYILKEAAEEAVSTHAADALARAIERVEDAQEKLAAAREFGSPKQVEYYTQQLREARAAHVALLGPTMDATTAQEQFLAASAGSADALGVAEQAALQMASAIDQGAGAVIALTGAFQTSKPAALEYAETLSAVGDAVRAVQQDITQVSAEEVGVGFGSAADTLSAHLSRLAGQIDLEGAQAIYNRYLTQLEDLYRDAAMATADGTRMTELELAFRREAIMSAFDEELSVIEDATRDQEGALRDMASQYNELRGVVTAALQPTEVTGLDMQLAAMGQYVDKWDESARRLDAIAARGFAELEAHPDWAAALKIPPEVLAGGEATLKEWARRTSSDVRSLFRPDLINIDSAADAVERRLRDIAARDVTIDLVIQELQARGISEEQARKQVRQMYGLEEALPVSLGLAEEAVPNLLVQVGTPEIPVALVPLGAGGMGGGGEEGEAPGGGLDLISAGIASVEEQAEDLFAAGSRVIELMGQGAETAAATVAIGGVFVTSLQEDLKGRTNAFRLIGDNLWGIIEGGFRAAMADAGLMDAIADQLLPFILGRLRNQGTYEGGKGEP